MTSIETFKPPISSTKSSISSEHNPDSNNSSPIFSSAFAKNNLSLTECSLGSSVSNSPTSLCQRKLLLSSVDQETTSYFTQTTNLKSKKLCPLNSSLLKALFRGYQEGNNSLSLISSIAGSELISIPTETYNKMTEEVQSQPTTIPNKCSIDDDTRALQLAVELTMINLNKAHQSVSTSPSMKIVKSHPQNHSPIVRPVAGQAYSSISPYHMTSKVFLQGQSHTVITAPITLSGPASREIDVNNVSRTTSLTDISQSLTNSIIAEDRSKKSQNMTECVPVPSSEHVAEIVGRQGCKIKALRAKTNTYIKTPVRNEEPVFVVTGRKEDVNKAKLEILSAAEHFTVIRATRRLNDNVVANTTSTGGKQQILGMCKNNLSPSSQQHGQVTIQVRVPYRLVGLVVGTKGNTIKHIQQETQTYIVTPSRDKEPVFEVTGLADNVELARRHIEIHIATRIGNSQNNSMTTSVSSPSPSPCATIRQSTDADSAESSLQSLNALNQILNDDLHSEILTSIYKNGICSTLDCNHIGGSIINNEEKCNNLHNLNGFLGDINVAMLRSDSKEKLESYSLNKHVNNQMKCVDFINTLMDTNVQQFGSEQRSKFT